MTVISLIPIKDWTWKLLLFGDVNIVAHYCCSRWMTPLYGLVTGGILTGSIALALLLKEYRKINSHSNTTVNDLES